MEWISRKNILIVGLGLLGGDHVVSVSEILLCNGCYAVSVSACTVYEDNALIRSHIEKCTGNFIAVFCGSAYFAALISCIETLKVVAPYFKLLYADIVRRAGLVDVAVFAALEAARHGIPFF